MDKLYYYVRRTTEALYRTKYAFNGGGSVKFAFQSRPATHKARGAVVDDCYSGDLRYFDDVKYDLDFGEDDEAGYAVGYTDHNDANMEIDLADDVTVDLFGTTTREDMEPSLCRGLR